MEMTNLVVVDIEGLTEQLKEAANRQEHGREYDLSIYKMVNIVNERTVDLKQFRKSDDEQTTLETILGSVENALELKESKKGENK